MKKTTIMSMTLLLVFSLFGQKAVNKRLPGSQKNIGSHNLNNLEQKLQGQLAKECFYTQPKSAFAIKHRLDSAITESYNASLNQWDPDEKEELSYYANGKLNFIISYNYTAKGGWEPFNKYEYSYNASGKFNLYNRYEWDAPTSNWILVYKIEYSYDAGGNLILEICSEKDGATWHESWKMCFDYNGNNQLTSDTNYLWDNGSSSLMPNSYNNYSYNANDDLTTLIYYHYDQANGWLLNMKSEYTYDADNYLIRIITSNWDDQSSQWKENSKNEFSVNWAGNVLEEIFYLYDDVNSQWNNNFKSVYAYSGSINPTNEEYYLWNDNNSQWEGTDKYNYTYNISYTLNDMILPPLNFFWPDYYELIHNMPLEVTKYNNDGSWKLDIRIRYHYSEHDVGISEVTDEELISLYPNPAKGFVVCETDKSIKEALFTLTDISGRAAVQQSVAGTCNIDLGSLQGGIYFYTIIIKDKVVKTGKLEIK